MDSASSLSSANDPAFVDSGLYCCDEDSVAVLEEESSAELDSECSVCSDCSFQLGGSSESISRDY